MCVCTLFCLAAQAQAVQTVHQLFTPGSETTSLELDIVQSPDQVEVRRSKGSRIAVETNVKISAANSTMLNYLIESGRYNLVQFSNTADGSYTLSCKKNNNVIIIKGEECIEEIRYVIFVPESIQFVTIKTDSGVISAKVQ